MTPAPEALDEVEELAVDGVRWLTGAARETPEGGLAWTTRPSDDILNPTLYTGTAGVVPVLLDAWRHFDDDSCADAALRAARSLADSRTPSTVSTTTPCTSAVPERRSSCGPCTRNSATPPPAPRPTARCTSCGRASTAPAGATCSS
ncbi:hypothetical protein [Streptomyces hyaluromycini]|uniref:hypothetical protein n=1 Tax=Streptomyces hyaluromycini TaxID=1377993 RepID=UPI001237D2D1|nr:hypothetical protein [Streptomyces hyaluromycini]